MTLKTKIFLLPIGVILIVSVIYLLGLRTEQSKNKSQETIDTCLETAEDHYANAWNLTCKITQGMSDYCESLQFSDDSPLQYLQSQPGFENLHTVEEMSEFMEKHRDDYIETMNRCTCSLSEDVSEEIDKIYEESKKKCYR